MSRILPAPLQSRITDPVTSRRWLLYMGYTPEVRLYSGQGTISWGGFTWNTFAFTVQNIAFDPRGQGSAQIRFSNLDSGLSALFLGAQGVQGVPALLYHYDAGEAVPLIEGYLDSADIGRSANVRIVSNDESTKSAPRLVCGPPLNNFVTPSGTIISWGRERLRVVRRDGS